VEARWSPAADALACLSVRSGFDALLRALAFPPGSEILVSALTIRDMPRIIEAHGLVPVPVDLDMATLALAPGALERAAGPRTRAILVAHLFGSRMPLEGVLAFAGPRGLVVLEDCAQADAGGGYRGHPGSDVAMFSFGPIKLNTALGGGILRVRDRALLERLRLLQAGYPVQGRWQFLRRLGKFGALKVLTIPAALGLFAAACRALGRTHDEVAGAAVRGFPGPGLLAKIRRQPSYPLLALLARRLRNVDPGSVERRAARARAAGALLPGIERPGARAPVHGHWVFPIQSAAPDALMRRLWARGFDATRGASSLDVVGPPADRPELAAAQAGRVMRQVLYLPVYPGVSDADLTRLARAVLEFEAGRGGAGGRRRLAPRGAAGGAGQDGG
jgi:perosamine synthetase